MTEVSVIVGKNDKLNSEKNLINLKVYLDTIKDDEYNKYKEEKKISKCFAIICLIFNIILPGFGTIIFSCYIKNSFLKKNYRNAGFIQFISIFYFLIGYGMAIFNSIIFIRASYSEKNFGDFIKEEKKKNTAFILEEIQCCNDLSSCCKNCRFCCFKCCSPLDENEMNCCGKCKLTCHKYCSKLGKNYSYCFPNCFCIFFSCIGYMLILFYNGVIDPCCQGIKNACHNCKD